MNPVLPPRQAWMLWQILSVIQDLLWQAYEKQFQDFACEESLGIFPEDQPEQP